MMTAIDHHRAARLDIAEAGYKQVLARMPQQADALHMLGLIQISRQNPSEAIRLIRAAIKYRPDNPEAYYNLGVALELYGESEEAQTVWIQAVQQRPSYTDAHLMLAKSYHHQWKMDAAVASFKRVIELDPKSELAFVLMASAYRELRKIDEAMACLRHLIGMNPNNANAYAGLGVALSDQGQVEQAVIAHRKAMELAPDVAEIHSNLCYCLHYHPDFDSAKLLEETRRWNARFAEPLRTSIQPLRPITPGEKKLRVGYVSPDFRVHPVGRFMLPVLRHHNRDMVEIHCFSSARMTDAVTNEIRKNIDHWHDCSRIDDQVFAERIRANDIDILFDLSLHSAYNRLTVLAQTRSDSGQLAWISQYHRTDDC